MDNRPRRWSLKNPIKLKENIEDGQKAYVIKMNWILIIWMKGSLLQITIPWRLQKLCQKLEKSEEQIVCPGKFLFP